MAETKPGGAYLRADGKTWVDANGNPTDPPARDERRAHDDAQAATPVATPVAPDLSITSVTIGPNGDAIPVTPEPRPVPRRER